MWNSMGLPDAGSSITTRAVLTNGRVAALDVCPSHRLARQKHFPGIHLKLFDATRQGPDPSGAGVHVLVGGQAPQEHGSQGCLRAAQRRRLSWSAVTLLKDPPYAVHATFEATMDPFGWEEVKTAGASSWTHCGQQETCTSSLIVTLLM